MTAAPISNFDAGRPPQLASSPAAPPAQNFQFERPDWALFRQIPTLSQKAGVSSERLRRLVLKELADNALDVADTVTCGTSDDGFYYIQDDGPGLSPGEVGRLFSINRPLVSSKLWRMPTRGALGNGLRVVAGAVAASDGELRIHTRDRRLTLKPEPDGSTSVVAEVVDFPVGTRVEIKFGAAMPEDEFAHTWAHAAIALHGKGESYRGRTSPHWYNVAALHEMMLAGGDRYVRDLITEFDGCTGAPAGKITGELKGRTCKSVTRAEADALLSRAKSDARSVKPHRLGYVGPDAFLNRCYARAETVAKIDGADIPAVIEAWAHTTAGRSSARFYVNRTPITGEVLAWRNGKWIGVKGCSLAHWIEIGGKFEVSIIVSVIAPYVPITTDGKEPNLLCFSSEIEGAIAKAIRAAKRVNGDDKTDKKKVSQKGIVIDGLDDAIGEISGGGAHEFHIRQLFYHIRPAVKEQCGSELKYENFEGIITGYEKEHGEIEGMLRDNRGVLYQPHIGADMPVGTRTVKNYVRPPWNFNKLLYIEKEGFFEVLRASHWPERHDCALLTSKGFASRAVRDLIDDIADGDEPITVFCVHDADSAGTLIFQTLQEETAARPRRLIDVVNLGLEPWEAVEMGLEVEHFDPSERSRAVARYVEEHEGDHDWESWLQTRRIELNAMTSPQFIAWLDQKMADHAGKVIPPADFVHDRIREDVEAKIEQAIREQILRESNLAERIAAALAGVAWPDDTEVAAAISEALVDAPHKSWADVVDDIVSDIASRR